MKKLLIVMVLALAVLVPIPVRATTGPFASRLAVVVDGETFHVWGVYMDYSLSRFRLRDMAYILNGTPAQFNIRETDNGRFDYWIIRGEPYVPTGNEFRPVDTVGIQGYRNGLWFPGHFYDIRAIVGLDGTDVPATAVLLVAAKCNADEIFICITELAQVLGFSMDWSSTLYFFHMTLDFFVEGVDYVISTTGERADFPDNPIEFLRLMLDLSGHWVDIAHFESTVIDESVVWPTELHFHIHGEGISNYNWVTTVSPLNRGAPSWYPVSSRELEGGYAEFTITDSRRIVVYMREHVDELTYYIENVPHRMIRLTENTRLRQFYQAEAAEGGGIRLRYLLGIMFSLGDGFTIYRSQVPGVRGDPVYSRERVPFRRDVEFIDHWRYDYRVLFEFIDTDVSYGVYYYMFSRTTRSGDSLINYGDEPWQIRVDVGALLRQEAEGTGETEAAEENGIPSPTGEPEEPENTEESSGGLLLWILLPAFVIVAGVIVWVAARLINIKRRQR